MGVDWINCAKTIRADLPEMLQESDAGKSGGVWSVHISLMAYLGSASAAYLNDLRRLACRPRWLASLTSVRRQVLNSPDQV